VLVGDEDALPYNRPPLSKEILRGEAPDELTAVEGPDWYARHRIEVLSGMAVTELDVRERSAKLADGGTVRFERCLLATGAAPRRPRVPGGEHPRTLRTLSDAVQIRSAARAAEAGAPAVVIGGGFIGVEAAASLAAIGLQVTIVELSAGLWAGSLGDRISAWAELALAHAGVTVRLQTQVTAVNERGVHLGEENLPTRIVVAGVGVEPRTKLAEDAGLKVEDGVLLDAARAAAPGVFGAGDVARAPHPLADGAGIRVEHWHAAREGGELAALSMLGEQVPTPRAPWVFSEFAGQMLDVVGWAPDRDEELLIGEAESGRFAVAYVRTGRVAQLAIVNGFIAAEEARRFVEWRPPSYALCTLVTA